MAIVGPPRFRSKFPETLRLRPNPFPMPQSGLGVGGFPLKREPGTRLPRRRPPTVREWKADPEPEEPLYPRDAGLPSGGDGTGDRPSPPPAQYPEIRGNGHAARADILSVRLAFGNGTRRSCFSSQSFSVKLRNASGHVIRRSPNSSGML